MQLGRRIVTIEAHDEFRRRLRARGAWRDDRGRFVEAVIALDGEEDHFSGRAEPRRAPDAAIQKGPVRYRGVGRWRRKRSTDHGYLVNGWGFVR